MSTGTRELLWQPYEALNFSNPYPMYKRLRETEPAYKAQTGEWILTKYEDVLRVLKDPTCKVGNRLEWIKKGVEYFQNKDEDLSAIYQAINNFVLFLNPPEHQAIKQFVRQAWKYKDVEEIIENNIHELIRSFKAKQQINLVDDYAQALPILTISKILGIDASDYHFLKSNGIAMIKALDLYVSHKDLVQMNEAAKAFISFFRKVIRQKEKKPGNDLITSIIQLNRQNTLQLSEEALISICIFLFIAGEETTASLIATGIFNLLKHPEIYQSLSLQPELRKKIIEELLRYDPPVQLLGRISTTEMIIGDKKILPEDTLTLVIAAANRDPDIFEQPDEFIINRQFGRHITFGSGIHYCLGDWLGRMQGEMAISIFCKTFPMAQLIDTIPEWNNNLAIKSLKKLS
ncbi:MAG TPA: cytochrome P450, partial [Cyclobacteriaceae bacterium]|nr:cytochrome P450 [Cyclobacteriaceae bacterium]